MLEIRKTGTFSEWLDDLTDLTGRSRILMRIERLRGGNFGDWKSVGDGIGELRIPSGPGYRVYFTKVGTEIVILLAGGDKKSQARDIPKAKAMAKQLEDIK
ncbi:MAG: type II toxin-antitoxin system RelE/ParE family toxin [Verrucomicrobiales bacterium]|nr:type II toxin-antitoxin system RelE/ParE family toxin [Verrucomicrobiales bacterium]